MIERYVIVLKCTIYLEHSSKFLSALKQTNNYSKCLDTIILNFYYNKKTPPINLFIFMIISCKCNVLLITNLKFSLYIATYTWNRQIYIVRQIVSFQCYAHELE